MSCNSCTKKFGLFCREFGCPNCNYTFCKNCLRKEIEVPRANNSKLKVCLSCFEKLEREKEIQNSINSSGSSSKHKAKTAAEELLSITEASDVLAPVLQPIGTAEEALPSNQNDDEINENLDSVIMKRLAGLKKNNGIELPTDSDMASRLANLKDVPHKEYSNTDILLPKEKKSDQEQINDLLKQFVEENDIDDRAQPIDPISDIEKRLAKLRGENLEPKTGDAIKDSGIEDRSQETEATTIGRLIKQYMEEAKLPDALITPEEKELITGLPPPSKDTEELPWCTICNEDAVLRCIGCGGDLFCRACFKECHDDEDFKEHETKTYSKPPNFKEDHF